MPAANGKKGTLLNTDFTHRYFEPEEKAGDETLVLLHGSGGDEMSLVEMARQVAPQAKLLAVRGRIVQDGVLRWYKRITPVSFDQTDIRAQADAFAAFLRKAVEAGTLDLAKTTFLGYSNGANLIGALTLMHPDLVHRAVLLRAMPVLDDTPSADLSKARFLTVAGEQDELYSPFAPKLAGLLEDHGASVQARTVKTGHLLGDDDVKVVTEWLASGDGGDKAIR
ncbi:MAG: alpha/beta hydrolase [Rhizobiaceae bacterium]|nr:alpha/beta hydrolase [Rhizobiaceae bacterium]MCV0408230.1 alpha/beta hydrolase [Rhizobiaceae bacterium]